MASKEAGVMNMSRAVQGRVIKGIFCCEELINPTWVIIALSRFAIMYRGRIL